MPPFEKGNQFSAGRPRGARNKATVWFEAVGGEGTEKVIRTVQKEAERGNMYAAALVLSRTWPRRRGRPVQLDMPPVETPAGLVQAQAALVAAMSTGQITPEEAASVASVLETQRRAIETHDHERRIRELENKRAEPALFAEPQP
jgi:hypothetical protein